jgi:pilus assembly protein Flp/PilA
MALDTKLLAQFPYQGFYWDFRRFNLTPREFPEARMGFSGRAAVHQPTPVAALQGAGNHRDPAVQHVGFFSITCLPINFLLTRRADFKDIRTQETGVSMMFKTTLKDIVNDTSGATAVEYGLIVTLIVIAMVGALQTVANVNNATWTKIEGEVERVMGDS